MIMPGSHGTSEFGGIATLPVKSILSYPNLGSGEIGGFVLTLGLYKWDGRVSVNSTGVTIAGTPLDPASRVTLVGGVLASNIVWAATSVVIAGASSHIEGVVLAKTAVTLETGL